MTKCDFLSGMMNTNSKKTAWSAPAKRIGLLLALSIAGSVPGSCNEKKEPSPQTPLSTTTNANANANELMPGATEADKDRALRREQIEAATKLCSTFPTDDNAVYLMGLILKEQGNSVEAITQFEKCLELNPKRPDACDSLGHALFLKGEFDRATELFQRALSMDPKLFPARIHLAECYKRMGESGKVISTLREDLRQDPTAFRLLGQAYQQQKDHPNAKSNFLAAIKLKPDLTEAYYGLIASCMGLGEKEQAKEYRTAFQKLKGTDQKEGRDWRREFNPLAITRQSVAHTHTDVGRVYVINQHYPAAEQLLRRAIALCPTNAPSISNLAHLCQQTNRPEEALEWLEKAIRLNPRNAFYHFQMGNLYIGLRQYPKAEQKFKEVIRLDPRRPDGYAALAGLATLTKKNHQEAIQAIRRAIQLDPQNPVYRRIHNQLLKQKK